MKKTAVIFILFLLSIFTNLTIEKSYGRKPAVLPVSGISIDQLEPVSNESIKGYEFKNNQIDNNTNIRANNIEPIYLEETFDETLEKDEKDYTENKNQNLFGLEEADIDFTSLQDVDDTVKKVEV
jgi:hypothetical protein